MKDQEKAKRLYEWLTGKMKAVPDQSAYLVSDEFLRLFCFILAGPDGPVTTEAVNELLPAPAETKEGE